MFPTPTAADSWVPTTTSENTLRRGDPDGPRRNTSGSLPKDIAKMVPTPTAQAAKHGATPDTGANAHGHNLWDLPHLLPTPTAMLAEGGNTSQSGDRKSELLLGGIIRSHDPEVWGPYADALDRHAAAVGSEAPAPVVDGKLNPGFVEWMMMLPAGWVTDLGFTRAAALRMLGNGVVPAQAIAAYGDLLGVAA